MQPKSIILFFYGYILFFRRQVDNKFIKNLNHGMGLSTKLFFKKHLLQILKEPLQDKICKKEVSYKCDELVYTFKEENHQIILNITN